MMADKCLAEGVERAGADVPENDADGRQRQLGQPVLAMAVNLYRFAAVSSIDTGDVRLGIRSEEHTSELQSLMRTQYAVFCLKKKHHELRLDCDVVVIDIR